MTYHIVWNPFLWNISIIHCIVVSLSSLFVTYEFLEETSFSILGNPTKQLLFLYLKYLQNETS